VFSSTVQHSIHISQNNLLNVWRLLFAYLLVPHADIWDVLFVSYAFLLNICHSLIHWPMAWTTQIVYIYSGWTFWAHAIT